MNTEQFELPMGWAWKTMSEIADVVGGGTPKTNDPSNYEGGTIPWITPADLSGYTAKHIAHGARFITQKGLEESSAKMMPAGTVLFTSRAPIGYVAIASNPVCTNQGFKSFVLKNGVLPDYVYWWLKGSKDLAESMASGTTFLELSGAKAKQIPIPVAPLDQQKRIVAEIEKQFSRLDEAVANLKRVKANLKRYKAAVLKAAVEGGFSGGTNGWSEMSLEELIGDDSVFVDGDWVESKDQDPEGDVRLVQLADIGDGVYRDRSSRFLTSKKAEKLRCTFLELADVLVARMPDPLGRACMFPGDAKKCVTVVDVCVIRPGLERIDRRWLMHTLNAPTNRAQIAALQAGSTRKRISRKNLATIQIHVPSHAVQEKVAQEVDRRFSIMEQLDTQIDANLQRAERMRQSILGKAFSGGLVSDEQQAMRRVQSKVAY